MVILSACTARVVTTPTSTVQEVRPTVEPLADDELCQRVPLEVVNETVPVPFAQAEPGVGVIPQCRYSIEFDPNSSAPRPAVTLMADLVTGDPKPDAVDEEFRDENDQVVAYQRIEGLGDAAGYGPYLRDPGSDTTYLVVLQGIEGGHWQIFAEVKHPDAGGITVEALRAFADRVLLALPR